MQTKNLILFLILSTVFVVGWTLFYNWKWPNKPIKPAELPVEVWPWSKEPRKDVQSENLVRLVAASAPAGPGLDNACRVAAEVLAINIHPLPRTVPPPVVVIWPWRYQPGEVQSEIFTRLLAAGPGSGLDQALRVVADLGAVLTHPPQRKVHEITLGDDTGFNLQVRLTPRGGAVRQVVLNHFQEADDLGLAMFDKDKKRRLELVPDRRIEKRRDDKIKYDEEDLFYHFNIYHYASTEDKRPLDTLSKVQWQAKEITAGREVQFTYDGLPDVVLTKTYTLDPGDYHLGLKIKIKRKEGRSLAAFRYQLEGAHGLPIEGQWYTTTFRNALVGQGTKRNLENSQEIANWLGGEQFDRGDIPFQYAGIAVQYFASVVAIDDEQDKKNFISWVRPTLEQATIKGRIKSIDKERNHLELLGPGSKDPQVFRLSPRVRALAAADLLREGADALFLWKYDNDQRVILDLLDPSTTNQTVLDDITVRLVSEPVPLSAGEVEHKYLLYHGPVKVMLLGQLEGEKRVSPELVSRYETTLQLKTLTDYGHYYFWSDLIIFFTNKMHQLLWFLHQVIPVYGLCIVCLTVLVRGLMFPVSRKAAQNSQQMQEKMAKLAPEIKKLQEKYKDDSQAFNQARTELYLKNGINPLSTVGGCLLLFAQMPIFMGLYYCLQESIFFRLEPLFSWLPWMRNLGAPDMLIWWSEKIPIISEPGAQQGGFLSFLYLGPYFNLLPVIAVSLMLVQQKLMAPPPTDEQQEMQMKMMKYMMVFMGLMFYKVAAGLCIYFITSSLWGVAERKLLPKKPAPGATPPPAAAGSGGGGGSRPTRRSRSSRDDSNGTIQKLKDWWAAILKEAKKK